MQILLKREKEMREETGWRVLKRSVARGRRDERKTWMRVSDGCWLSLGGK